MEIQDNSLKTLIPLEDFKALMGVDDRDDKTARFCLVTSTLTIEQFCKRKFFKKQYFETIKFNQHQTVFLNEYPVTEILAVYTYNDVQLALSNGQILEPEFYHPMIGNDYNLEMPFELWLSPSLIVYNLAAVKVIYYGGYVVNPHPCGLTTRSFSEAKTPTKETAASLPHIPTDLSAACFELASWNMNRYHGRRIGMTGNIRGTGVQGEHFELSMPENVRQLLGPYKRKTI